MKLLFDQNISPKILRKIVVDFPSSSHVRFEGLTNASDISIFNFAKENQYTIVTFDYDFVDLALVNGFPPKVIWLHTGNLTTKFITELFEENIESIKVFIDSDSKGLLEILK